MNLSELTVAELRKRYYRLARELYSQPYVGCDQPPSARSVALRAEIDAIRVAGNAKSKAFFPPKRFSS